MKKIILSFLCLFPLASFAYINTGSSLPAGVVTNQFQIPIRFDEILVPTNFLAANPCATNQVITFHPDGTKETNTAAGNTDIDRGNALGAACDNANGQSGDVIFVGAGRWDVSTYSVVLSLSPLDLSGFSFGSSLGVNLVGAGKDTTLIDCGDASGAIGTWTSFRDVTISNFYQFGDYGSEITLSSNKFLIYKNTRFISTNTALDSDLFIPQGSNPNYWFESCDFYGIYDIFASNQTYTNQVLISTNCTYYVDATANGTPQPYPRVQFGSMAANCYSVNDTITVLNGTASTIGVSAGETAVRPSNVYIWGARIATSAGGVSFSKGAFSTSKIFVGPGCTFDALGNAVDAAMIASRGVFGFTGIVTNWGTGVTSNRVYYSSGIVTNVTRP